MSSELEQCTLCGRARALTFHHLIPRKLHRRNRFRRIYTRDELQAGIDVCRLCHHGLHALFDEVTLGERLATLDDLRADPEIRKHVAWSRKQKR